LFSLVDDFFYDLLTRMFVIALRENILVITLMII